MQKKDRKLNRFHEDATQYRLRWLFSQPLLRALLACRHGDLAGSELNVVHESGMYEAMSKSGCADCQSVARWSYRICEKCFKTLDDAKNGEGFANETSLCHELTSSPSRMNGFLSDHSRERCKSSIIRHYREITYLWPGREKESERAGYTGSV